MYGNSDLLETLAKQSMELDPSTEERTRLLEAVKAYVSNYIDELPQRKGFEQGKFPRLAAMPINEQPTQMQALIRVLAEEVDVAGITSASGRHLGFIPGGGLFASALADLLSDTTNKYSGIAFSGPGSVKIETEVIRWMCDLMGYPATAFGNLTSGGSVANLIAVKAARDAHGVDSTNVRSRVIYAGQQTHHSVYKALNITGLHECVLRKIPLTEQFRIDTAALAGQMKADVAEGLTPFLVVGAAGTTDTGAVDPLDELAELASKYRAWFHVDAAYGGFFMLLDEMKEKLKGINRADSIVLDPHKTLFLPFGSGTVLVKDVKTLLQSNAHTASYLVDTEGMHDINPSDTGVELTRPGRGLRIWLPLQLHGVAAFRACLREKLLLSDYFYNEIKKLGFETGPCPDLTVSIFRHPEEGNTFNQQLIESVHRDGTVFLSSTLINGKLWLRCAVVAHRTHKTEIDLALEMLKRLRDAQLAN